MFTLLPPIVTDYIFPTLFGLNFLIFIHEMGHYLVARYNKVKVQAFSIGFGPEIFGFNDKFQTRWKLCWIPIGGYVQMADEKNKQDSLHSKSVSARIAISAAGPGANFLLAFFLIVFLFCFKGMPSSHAKIIEVLPARAAISLQVGDEILAIDDTIITSVGQLKSLIKNAIQAVEIIRDNQMQTVLVQANNGLWGVTMAPANITYNKMNILNAPAMAVKVLFYESFEILKGIGRLLSRQSSSKEMGGLITIGDVAGKSAQSGIYAFIWFLAVFSLNLGVINLLPIPILDGGHIALYIAEAIKGQPVSQKIQELISYAGLVLLLVLMFWSNINDLFRYIG